MKKIFWRVFVAFGVVLLVFTILIGLMFTRFNRTNIVGAYKQQLGDLADGVVTRTSQAVKDHVLSHHLGNCHFLAGFPGFLNNKPCHDLMIVICISQNMISLHKL